MIKVKAFLEALNIFNDDPDKFKRYLDDKRLNLNEKNILKGYLLLRDSKFKEAKELIQGLHDITDPVVKAYYHLLMGMILSSMSEHWNALREFEKCLRIIPKNELPHLDFSTHLNMCVTYYNLKIQDQMFKELSIIKTYKTPSKRDQLRVLTCEFNLYSMSGDLKRAGKILKSMHNFVPHMSESDLVSYQLHKFNYCIQNEKIDEAIVVLDEMKQNRKFAISDNYRFYKKLMDHYVNQKPLYFQAEEFDKKPYLLCHMRVLQFMEERKWDEARVWWDKLSKYHPQYYLDEFRYIGPKNLFSLCLNRFMQTPILEVKDIDENLSKSKAVIDFLLKAKGPVSREVLFKFLWKRDAQDKEDFVRLSRKMYRLKKQFDLEIQYKKGCYLIVSKDKKAS